MGFIGIGNRGSQLLKLFMAQPEVEVTALCDIYEPYLTRNRAAVAPWIFEERLPVPKMNEVFATPPKRYKDYRDLLADPKVDAVCIATPDHWHSIQTIAAIKAGKDVYVEKPLSITLREGRLMAEAQRASKQVVAVGINRRGCDTYQRLAGITASGRLGEFMIGRAGYVNNLMPNGIGRQPESDPPPGFDWDAWLGPRPFRPFKRTYAPYRFRWHSEFSSQMGNWGVHHLDALRWLMGETAPCAITAVGGRYRLHDDADIPDLVEVTFEFSSRKFIRYSTYETCGGSTVAQRELEIRSDRATVYVNEAGYDILPASRRNAIRPETYASDGKLLEDGSGANSTTGVIRNFLDCVASRGVPFCTLETGHRSTSFAHLANIALKIGKRLEWDAAAERFTNSEEANALLHYTYRKPYAEGLA